MDLSVSSTCLVLKIQRFFFFIWSVSPLVLISFSLSDAAEPVGTFVHQLVRRDDAAFLQHAHLQVEHRVVP